MGKLVAAALALALLAVPSGAAAARAKAKATPAACAAVRHGLDGSAQVRAHGHPMDGTVYACSLETGRRIRLGENWPGSSSGVAWVRAVVAGRLVAWYRAECPGASGGPCWVSELKIANVHSGKVRLRRRLTQPGGHVPEVVLKPNGSAAWVERGYVEGVGMVDTLRRRQPGGEDVVAEGASVAGLALSENSTLYFTEGGIARSARLEPATPPRPVEQRRPPCGDPGTAIAANAWLRVWDSDGHESACSLESRRVVAFGDDSAASGGTTDVGPYALAGRLVAWHDSLCSTGEGGFLCDHRVNLVDMRTGSREAVAASTGPVRDLVLNRNGSVAWIDDSGVRVVDRDGDRTLGPGTDLALSHGSTLYWTGPGGVPRSSALR